MNIELRIKKLQAQIDLKKIEILQMEEYLKDLESEKDNPKSGPTKRKSGEKNNG